VLKKSIKNALAFLLLGTGFASAMVRHSGIPSDDFGGLIMETRTPEEKFSQYVSIALEEESLEETDVDQSAAVISAEAGPLWRRCEARTAYQQTCSYEVLGHTKDESFVIEQGEAFALDRSADGILLFMGRALQEKQLIEVHISRSRWGRTANIYEARWIKPIQLESGEMLYLVGGRRIFGPCDYLSF